VHFPVVAGALHLALTAAAAAEQLVLMGLERLAELAEAVAAVAAVAQTAVRLLLALVIMALAGPETAGLAEVPQEATELLVPGRREPVAVVVEQVTEPDQLAALARRLGPQRSAARLPGLVVAAAALKAAWPVLAAYTVVAAAHLRHPWDQALRASSLRPTRQVLARHSWLTCHGINWHRSSRNERRRASVNRPRARPDLAAGKCHRAIRLYSSCADYH
jgi:hypothetical protein